ncbi:MAG: FHA domain-containing protein [Symploca sp. SIO1B1]|nr:FHA domain-containing protein [Symploca sp. SIO1B1]
MRSTGATKRKLRLVHVQTTTLIELPEHLENIRIGKPDRNWQPDIDVSNFPNSDIVSRSHVEIRISTNRYSIEDLGSSNGTYLNHSLLTPFTPCQLHIGDRIDFGKDDLFTFLFREAQIGSTRVTSNSINERVTPTVNGDSNSQQEGSFVFDLLGAIWNIFSPIFNGLIAFFGNLLKRLVSLAIKIGIFLVSATAIVLVALFLFFQGYTDSPKVVKTPPVIAPGDNESVNKKPVIEIPTVKLPPKKLVEPRRFRLPYTPENRPSGQPSCDCPFDRANDWSICGGRSAYAKTGGREPICYEGEKASRQLWYYSSETSFVDRERPGK